jgi:hypothetical protein
MNISNCYKYTVLRLDVKRKQLFSREFSLSPSSSSRAARSESRVARASADARAIMMSSKEDERLGGKLCRRG